MTMRERLARALWSRVRMEGVLRCRDKSEASDLADAILAALGPDVVLVTVNEVARRAAEYEGDATTYAKDPALWDRMALRLLGDGAR